MSEEFENYMAFRDPPGFVYLIHCSDSPYYKIGRATDLLQRLSGLQGGCPFVLEYTFWAEVERPKKIEFEIHKNFADKRHKGEWFLLGQSEVDFIIKTLKKQSPNCMNCKLEIPSAV